MLHSLRLLFLVAAFATVQLTATLPAFADECSDAVVDYNSILSRLNDAQEHYATCVADSKGMDDCARAFQSLRLAHGQFEAAVAMYIKSCR